MRTATVRGSREREFEAASRANLMLVGFMGSGKTTVGRRLAEKLAYSFVDTDEEIEKRSGRRIAEIFESQGEEVFRALERQVIAEIARGERQVVSCGGGVVLSEANVQSLRLGGFVVYLSASTETLYDRLKEEADRPLLRVADRRRAIRDLLDARAALYETAADLVIEVDERDVKDVCAEILEGFHARAAERRVHVSLGPRSYPIIISDGSLAGLGAEIKGCCDSASAVVVSNERIWKLYEKAIVRGLGAAGIAHRVILVQEGEAHKSLREAERIYDKLLEGPIERFTPIVAVGGGVIGDLAGYVAATFMRGMPLIQVPTTLLAQVDSSVGGKVAVNHPKGKNLIGSFHQPCLVLADVSTLNTLPSREFRNGLAEVIKYGFIGGEPLLSFLEGHLDRVLELDSEILIKTIAECCRMKANIVEADERDFGRRAVLNFGHTLGHALETASGFALLHGEAVAVGMVFAARLSVELSLADEALVTRLVALLERAGLPVLVSDVERDDVEKALMVDKKRYGGANRVVLLEGPGRPLVREVPAELVGGLIESFAGARADRRRPN